MTPLVDPALAEPLRDPQAVLGALDFAGVAVFAASAEARPANSLLPPPAGIRPTPASTRPM